MATNYSLIGPITGPIRGPRIQPVIASPLRSTGIISAIEPAPIVTGDLRISKSQRFEIDEIDSVNKVSKSTEPEMTCCL